MQVLVIGGGPAGMMAAGQAAAHGASVTLLEKNDRLGRKLALTGKGRGNLTNTADLEDFIAQYPGNGAFLYGPLYRFTNDDVCRFFHSLGVPTVEERGGRVFPASQQAKDLVAALEKFCLQAGVRILRGRRVTGLLAGEKGILGAACGSERLEAEAVILATGGASYPATGSTGDGYRLAAAVGHTIVPPRPALVPLLTKETWAHELAGLTLKNVTATLLADGRRLAEEFGEMLFTHDGVSGPIILTVSRQAAQAAERGQLTQIRLNLKPALAEEQLDARLQRDFAKYRRKQFKNSLHDLLPKRMIAPVVQLAQIPPELPVNQITKEQRRQLAAVLTGLTLTVTGTRPLAEAIVTAGGVATTEINPATMESKIIPGLFFAGEVIDVDGNTGGYNLQAAFSTGYVAGIFAAAKVLEA